MEGAGVIIGFAAGTCCGDGAVVDPGGRVFTDDDAGAGDDDAGAGVRDVGLTMAFAAAFDSDGGGGALPFGLMGWAPPARPCCNVAVP
jgi:hypothetical protein